MKHILKIISVFSLLILGGCGQQHPSQDLKIISIIQPLDHPSLNEIRDGFVETLENEQFIDGKNIEIRYYNAQNDAANYKSMSEKIAKESDLIFAIATPAAQAVASETSDIPIILGAVTDPIGSGLVTDMTAENSNIAGISDQPPIEKQVDFLLDLLPTTKTIGTLYNSSEVNSQVQIEQLREYASSKDITIIEKTVTITNDVQQAAESLVGKVDALYVPNDNTVASSMATIKTIVETNKLPLVPSALADAKIAGIGTVGMSQYTLGEQAAQQAAQVLRGDVDIKDLPIETIDDVEIYINEEMCKLLGIDTKRMD